MKLIFSFLLFASFSAHASTFMSVKERLRLYLWVNGLEESKSLKKYPAQKTLPEELERALRKI